MAYERCRDGRDRGVSRYGISSATGSIADGPLVGVEFEYGPYAVSVDLPEMADPATLKASLENGILSVAVAKRPETQARRIEIA